ncbi:hypothetical protein ACFQ3Z_21210 [Streptomyces nogalater]
MGLNRLGGFRNEVVFVLTGLDIEAKAALVREQLADALAKSPPREVRWELVRTDRADADTEETASALLRLVVRDPDQQVVGRALSGAAVELALASYPGFHVLAPPGKGAPYGVFEDVYVPYGGATHVAVLHDGRRIPVPPPRETRPWPPYRTRPCRNPSRPDRPGGRPSAWSPAPAAGTRAGTPTSGCGPGPRTPGGGSPTR